ncbi:MAG: anthranilate phosphoribosyltransferase [Firmicutes bacterium]|nr:anthranilate phosphoribosyltransferase [Bacillota bacterium]
MSLQEDVQRQEPLVEAIQRLVSGESIGQEGARQAMEVVMRGWATQAQIGAFMVALRMKGETPQEVAGCAEAMRAQATPLPHHRQDAVDTCGTGGDGGRTFNVSTAAAFVVAGAGAPVAKHGNRAVSGRSGSADVLEAMGIRVDLPVQQSTTLLDNTGIAFLFAPVYHAAMRFAAPVRQQLAMRSVFNLLGPLTNPARTAYQLVGVYDASLLSVVAEALGRLGVQRTLVVHSRDGLDEVSISAPTDAVLYDRGQMESLVIEPQMLGLTPAPLQRVAGGTAYENAQLIGAVLRGVEGPSRAIVIANAGTALFAADKAASLKEGCRLAEAAIDSGAAFAKLEALRQAAQQEVSRVS